MRICLLLPLVLAPSVAIAQTRTERPSWGEAAAGGALVAAGAVGGGLAGVKIGEAMAGCASKTWFCGLEESVVGALAGGSVGTVAVVVGVRHVHGRGSILGGSVGAVAGAAFGAAVGEGLVSERCTRTAGGQAMTCETSASAVMGVLSVAAGAMAGVTLGLRYGPWARGAGSGITVTPTVNPASGSAGGVGLRLDVRF